MIILHFSREEDSMFDVLGLYAFYGLGITLNKAAMNYAQPLFFLGVRLLLSSSVLLGYLYFFKHQDIKVERKHISLFAQSALMLYSGFAFGFWALHHMNTSKNALFFTLTPFITAFLVYVLYGDKLTMKQICGLVIGFVGVLPALLVKADPSLNSSLTLIGLPEIAAIIAIAAGAYGWILANTLIRKHAYSPFFINALNMAICGALLLATTWVMNVHNEPYYLEWQPFIAYVLVLCVVNDIVTYNLYMVLLKKYSTTFLAFAGFLVPLYVAFYSWVWLGEVVTWHFFASLFIIFWGLYLFYRGEQSKRAIISHK